MISLTKSKKRADKSYQLRNVILFFHNSDLATFATGYILIL